MKSVPVEERLAFLERDLMISNMMLTMLMAYLQRSEVLSLDAFEAWQQERLRLLSTDVTAESMFRKSRLSEMVAEARAVLSIAAPPKHDGTGP